MYSRYLVDSIVDVARSRAWSHWVSLGPKALAELRSWIVRVESGFAASIIPERRPPALVFLASDAGDVGWGGHVVQPLGSVAVSPLPPAHDVFSPADRARSSTWRELRGVCCVLSAYGREIEGQSVDFQVDSLTSALIHVKGGSLRRDAALGRLLLQEELLAIEDICLARRVWLRLVWVPRELNQLADDESKIVDVHNYSLCHDQFLFLSERWGPYDVDRFAAASNTQLPCFNSRWACPGSSAVDAFRADWRGFNNWLHPPTPLIAAVLQKMRADGASGTLLALGDMVAAPLPERPLLFTGPRLVGLRPVALRVPRATYGDRTRLGTVADARVPPRLLTTRRVGPCLWSGCHRAPTESS